MASVAVELKLLGGFELRQAGGRVIDPSGQKDRALLAFLALPSLTSHPREKLASLLWSDRGDQQARDSLKHSLTRLRQSLQPLTPVMADRQSVKLDPAGMTIDVATFERLVSNGTVESLVQAGTIYRGDLLENFNIKSAPFAEWLLIERQRLRHLFEAALTRLLSESLAAKSFDSTAAAARRLLSLDPLHEPATRALMHIHAGRGQVAQALKLYDTLRGRLNNELGVGPAPETTRLYETIKQQRSVSAAANPLPAEPLHSTTVPTIPLPDKPSIAVLPFENLSGDAGQQYFSDGITEDITTELSRFRTLFVIARQSSFAFKSRSIKVQEIARELGVAFIVEGSVRRAADRVRISAQLIDAATGNHLWAEKYDREILDIFAVQDEVARSVAAAVSGRVDVAGRDRVERLSPTALKAYDLVLRAKYLTTNYTRTDNAEAIACAERAVELNPSDARACVHLAWCHFYNYMAQWTENSHGSLTRAFTLAQRAPALDESDSFAHSMLGIVHWDRREFDEARSEILAGVALNPNDFLAHRYYGMFLAATGEAEKGIEQIELGRRLNPFDTRWVPWNMGIACFTAHRYDEAIAWLKQARNPINEVRGWLTVSYAHAGFLPEARSTLEEFLKIAEVDMAVFPGRKLKDWHPYWHAAFEYQDDRDFNHLFEALRKAGLED